MRKWLSLTLIGLLALSTAAQSKLGGTGKVGGTTKASTSVAAGTLDARVGSFSLTGSTGNQSVSSLGFQPKVVLFFYNAKQTADGTINDSVVGFGVGISSTERRAIWTKSTYNQASSVNYNANQNASCIHAGNGNVIADYVSSDTDGFTINVTATDGSTYIINYLALGGSALTNYKLGTGTVRATAGTQGYTGVGFQPTCLITFMGRVTSEPVATTGPGNGMFGVASSATARGMIGWRSTNGANPIVTVRRQSTQRVVNVVTADLGADLQSFDADGFTLNYPTGGLAGTEKFYYLALRGPQFKVTSFNQATATGNQDITGAGFTPKVSIMISANDVTANNDTQQNNATSSLGAATSTSARFSMWAGDTNNVSPTDGDQDLDRTKIIKLFSVGTPTLNAAADHVSFLGDGQRINWTTVDATAREIIVLWMG